MKENERLLKPMSVGDVLDYSIEVYKRNFKKLTLLALIFYIPFMFLYSLAISYLSGDLLNLTQANSLSGDMSSIPYTFIAYYLSLLGLGLVYLAYSVTLKSVMDASIAKVVYYDVVHNRGRNIKEVIGESFKRFPALLANRILYFLIMLGIGIGVYIGLIIIMLIFVFGAAFSFITPGTAAGIGNPVAAVISGVIASVLLIAFILAALIVFSYFYARFGMGVQSVVIENSTGSEAVSRCNAISKRNFWNITLSFIFGFIIFFTIPTVISYCAQLLIVFDRNAFILANTAAQVVWALLDPYLATLLTVLFINLRVKNEGLDLEVKVDRLLEERELRKAVLENGDPTDAK